MIAIASIGFLLVIVGLIRRKDLPFPAFACGLALWLGVVFLCVASIAAFAQPALNPGVTSENTAETICVPNWTKTVRPPVSYTNQVKRAEMLAAGIAWSHAAEIELDHRVPLVLGGAPRDRRNLWLQTWAPAAPEGWQVDADARAKDQLEVRLHKLVCSGELPLAEAQACIFNDWRACAAQHLKGTP